MKLNEVDPCSIRMRVRRSCSSKTILGYTCRSPFHQHESIGIVTLSTQLAHELPRVNLGCNSVSSTKSQYDDLWKDVAFGCVGREGPMPQDRPPSERLAGLFEEVKV